MRNGGTENLRGIAAVDGHGGLSQAEAIAEMTTGPWPRRAESTNPLGRKGMPSVAVVDLQVLYKRFGAVSTLVS